MILPLLLALVYEDVTAHPAAPLPPAPQVSVQQGVGSLDVTISNQQITGAVARGTQRVPFMQLTLSAGCDNDVSVDSITVTHRGLGDSQDIRAVYLAEGSKRLTKAVHFDARSLEATLRLKKMVIPACSAKTISVLADISQAASPAGEHTITILSADDVQTSANNVSLSTNDDAVTVETKPIKEGALTVRMLSVPSNTTYGNIAKTARFQISSDTVADHMLRSITLKNLGTARNYDLRSNYLETSSGQRVSRLTKAMDGDTITMVFDPPYLLKKNSDVVFVLRSEVKGSYKTVQFSLDEPSDLEATLWKKP